MTTSIENKLKRLRAQSNHPQHKHSAVITFRGRPVSLVLMKSKIEASISLNLIDLGTKVVFILVLAMSSSILSRKKREPTRSHSSRRMLMVRENFTPPWEVSIRRPIFTVVWEIMISESLSILTRNHQTIKNWSPQNSFGVLILWALLIECTMSHHLRDLLMFMSIMVQLQLIPAWPFEAISKSIISVLSEDMTTEAG